MATLIHCTQKLLAEIPAELIDAEATGESWHANLFLIARRKCVLFTHDATLYSVFVPGLKKPEFAGLEFVFGQRLFTTMRWDEFSQEQIERMLDACRVIRCARSNNRSVLGSMNDLRFQIEVHAQMDGGLDHVDLFDLHHRLNRISMSAIGGEYSVARFREYLSRTSE